MGKIWAIASGCGGAGKTTLALSLAVGAAQKGLQTILVDAAGLSRSCDLLLGIESTMTVDLFDTMTQQLELSAALYSIPQCKGLRIANASLHDHVSLSEFSGTFLALQSMCDVLVIDLESGQVPDSKGVLTQQDELIYVLRPDNVSIRSTECLMQKMRGCEAGGSLVLNHVRKDRVKKGIQYAREAVSMTLDCPCIGIIAADDSCASEIAEGRVIHAVQRIGNPMKDILNQLLRR